MSGCTYNVSEASSFEDPWYYTYANGSTIYCPQEFNFQCNATFSGDSDIGGYGVLISFIVVAAISTLAAIANTCASAFPPKDSFNSWVKGQRTELYAYQQDITTIPDWRLWHYQFSDTLLPPLCDLQLITGIGIVIAGLVQLDSISMYHYNFVCNYWWLTFNSMWACQRLGTPSRALAVSLRQADPRQQLKKRGSRLILSRFVLQRVLIMIAVALSIYTQSVYTIRASTTWDPLTSGRCFRYGDNASIYNNWLWIAGLCIYMVGVSLSLTDTTWDLVEKIDLWMSKVERKSISTCWSLCDLLSLRNHPVNIAAVIIFELGVVLALLCAVLLVLLIWVVRQFSSILAVTDGTPAIVFALYLAMWGWATGDAIQVKVLNIPLVEDETRWGFGQILPMILLLSVVLLAIDARDKADDLVQKKQDLLNQQMITSVGLTGGQGTAGSHSTSKPPMPMLVQQKKYERPFSFLGLQLCQAAQRDEAQLPP